MAMVRRLESGSSATGVGWIRPPMQVDCTLGDGLAAGVRKLKSRRSRRKAAEVAKDYLCSAYGESINAQRGRGYRAEELEIVGNLRDVEEDFLQVSGDGDFFDRIGELSARDPQARGTAGIITRHQIRAVPEKFSDVETLLDFGNQLLRRPGSGLQKIVPRADAGRAGKPAGGVARGRELQLFVGVCIQKIRIQNAFFNHHPPA